MDIIFAVGNVLGFTYNGRVRKVRVEKVVNSPYFLSAQPILITGWDSTVNNYRSFFVNKIHGPISVD